ncbi:HEPN domain-containing protein [Hankyongella ginsenosidimutans]|uniref:HEPN domain-containing protein n=1 Tax=Hankyongella ginsenosidimutans TaxID=1763828 RepID=A0A4D7BYT1_9SPHN|nr:HEPN domain-containing protein [Hankyongella ginsenosidimutans]QCI80489.1 HEPN domain-containing protein [Hankyongella ginsenosidimutans]
MRRDVDHLPARQRGELERVQRVLMDEFAEAIAKATSPSRRNGKILKIILFGSYAREDWVDDPVGGYRSDFDLLVVVTHDDLTDIAHYWYVAEDKILRDAEVGRQVNIIVHSLDEVNQSLKRGEYFWVDIARDGIVLYELPCHPLATPMPLTAADAYAMAKAYFDEWLPNLDRSIRTAELQLAEDSGNAGWRKDAAFTLHQATERAYICFLLVQTLYFPKSHNIKFLRSLAESNEPRLVTAWPRDQRIDRRRFQLLKRAYVEARYSTAYAINTDDLEAILACVRTLRGLVEEVSCAHLAQLEARAKAD